MSFRRRRLFRVRPKRTISGRRRSHKLIWIGILLLTAVIVFDYNLRPVVTAMSSYQAKTAVTSLINQAASGIFSDPEGEYSNFVTLKTNSEGNITSIETNTQNINRAQTGLTQKVVDALVSDDQRSIMIPLGTLTGVQIFSGLGPDIEIKVIPVGSVKVVTESRFTSSGVNQTLHQVVISVDANAMAIVPGYSTEVSVHTEYILAETMVVGTVPDSYAQIIAEGESALPYLAGRLSNGTASSSQIN